MIGMTLFGWIADSFGPGVSLTTIGVVNGAAAVVSFVLLPVLSPCQGDVRAIDAIPSTRLIRTDCPPLETAWHCSTEIWELGAGPGICKGTGT